MFIHIDENELINLTKLCYKIFSHENVNILIWKKINKCFDKNRIEKSINNIKSSHEFVILCYKNKGITEFNNMKQPRLVNGDWINFDVPMESVLDNLGTTSSAKDELAEIFGKRDVFSTPKPMRLAKEFVRVATNKNSIVLDFFAGSGTTGHAVMDLNIEDGGNRKFILITNNENDICKKVTIPRIMNYISTSGEGIDIKLKIETI
jgi:adenine specific DNA methylase Mod